MTLIVELLEKSVHARESFSNQDSSIEQFLKSRANQEHKKHISDTYVLVNDQSRNTILGYFTLSIHSVLLCDVPEMLTKNLPSYPTLGTVLLGRIGRDQNLTPHGFGFILLKEAIKKSLEKGSFFALELNAKNEVLIKYYQKFGFISLKDNPYHMILPYSILKKLYK